MRDHEHVAVGHLPPHPVEGGKDPLLERLVGLEARRSAAVLEVAGPGVGDLVLGQALPLARVTLAEAGVDQHGADADQLGDDLGGGPGPLEVAGHHGVDGADVLGGVGRLVEADLRQRWVGLALPAPEGVPLRLAVADDQDAEHGPGS